MQKPSWFENNLTLGNVLVLGTLVVGGIMGWAGVTNSAANVAAAQAKFEEDTSARLDKIDASLSSVPQLTYRVTAQEEQLKATNARIDASLQTLSSRLAEINQALGSLDRQVAVLTQRLEMVTPQRRTDARSRVLPTR